MKITYVPAGNRPFKIVLPMAAGGAFYGAAVVYVVTLSWFFGYSSDIDLAYFMPFIKFYFIGAIPLFALAEIVGAYLFCGFAAEQARRFRRRL